METAATLVQDLSKTVPALHVKILLADLWVPGPTDKQTPIVEKPLQEVVLTVLPIFVLMTSVTHNGMVKLVLQLEPAIHNQVEVSHVASIQAMLPTVMTTVFVPLTLVFLRLDALMSTKHSHPMFATPTHVTHKLETSSLSMPLHAQQVEIFVFSTIVILKQTLELVNVEL